MVEAYTKSPLTFEQQLQQLKDHGLIIENDDFALSQLRTISYYRLSAYWHPFRKIEQGGTIADDFEEGTHFDEVMTLAVCGTGN
ncbi:MAG: Abi family protein [Gammaproteobacteria bacterium]|nr:Abi family protein [Gammaproteobacteria bacterium]